MAIVGPSSGPLEASLTPLSIDLDLLIDVTTVLGLGALLGTDRERHAVETHEAGLRTFMLFSASGAMTVWLARAVEAPSLVAAGALAAAWLVVARPHGVPVGSAPPQGHTTQLAAFAVFLLGGMVAAGLRELAVVLGIAIAALLTYKTVLHRVASTVGPDDLQAVVKLLAATFIVLPLLPDHAVDPWGALVPRTMWWMVILISGLSLVGYIATRWLDERRGRAITGIFGGLVSSTAVTLALSRDSRREGVAASAIALGVLLSWTVMLVRVVAEVAVVNRALLPSVAPPFVAMGAVSVLAVLGLALDRSDDRIDGESAPELTNPFSLTSAMQFAALFAVVLVVVALAEQQSRTEWIYAIAALSGTTDVDAITLSLADSANRDLAPATAVTGIVVAAVSNTVVKTGLVLTLATRQVAVRVAVVALVTVVAGLLTTWWWA